MAKFTATIEQASDGSWSALAVIGDHSVFGDGDTREAALGKLREGLAGEIEHLKSKGQTLPQSSVEIVTVEVAAWGAHQQFGCTIHTRVFCDDRWDVYRW